MDLQTEIEYDVKLEDKTSPEYAAKKTAIYGELKTALENAAQTTDAELVEDGFDVTFSELATTRYILEDFFHSKIKSALIIIIIIINGR